MQNIIHLMKTFRIWLVIFPPMATCGIAVENSTGPAHKDCVTLFVCMGFWFQASVFSCVVFCDGWQIIFRRKTSSDVSL